MIRKLQPTNKSDQIDFEIWAAQMKQAADFNWTGESFLKSFQEDNCWGLWHSGQMQSVLCFLGGSSNPLEILWLGTSPASQGLGLMKRLLTEVLNNVTRQSFLKPGEVLLEVHEMNLKAIKLYGSLGFKEFGRRKNYYQDGAAALLMSYKVE